MEIKLGAHYVNRTWKYLLPCLKGHGKEFTEKLQKAWWLAAGIHDDSHTETEHAKERYIYLLCDSLYHPKFFTTQLTHWLRYMPYFIAAYPYKMVNGNAREVMLILKVPEEYEHAYDMFLEGRYSEMYTPEQIKDLFTLSDWKEYRKVLTKSTDVLKDFRGKMIEEYDTYYSEHELMEFNEYDLPLKRKEEVFNCQEVDRMYFDKQLDKY